MARHYNRWTISVSNTVSAFLPHAPRELAGSFLRTSMRRCVHFSPPGRSSTADAGRRRCPRLARESRPRRALGQGRVGSLRPQRIQAARRAIRDRNADRGGSAARRRHGGLRQRRQSRPRRGARRARCGLRLRASTWRAMRAQARVDAIAGEGAEVIRVDGSYDDAVRILQEEAAANGWTIVSDTSWPGYERIPFLIMLGYTRMMDEVRDQGSGIGIREFDVVFVQGGVGGLLCAIASWCAFHRPDCKVIGVEPTQAACLQASARAGHAGGGRRDRSEPRWRACATAKSRRWRSNRCCRTSTPSWRSTTRGRMTRCARSARPLPGDPAIAAGASGSAALGGLLALCRDASMTRGAPRNLASIDREGPGPRQRRRDRSSSLASVVEGALTSACPP